MPRVARRGKEPSGRLGRRRRTVERALSRLGGCRHPRRRYRRRAEQFLVLVGIAGVLVRYRRLG